MYKKLPHVVSFCAVALAFFILGSISMSVFAAKTDEKKAANYGGTTYIGAVVKDGDVWAVYAEGNNIYYVKATRSF